jgi:cadmium resistance protein CadD (predicted permease)
MLGRIMFLGAVVATLASAGVWVANVSSTMAHGSLLQRLIIPVIISSLGIFLFVERGRLTREASNRESPKTFVLFMSAITLLFTVLAGADM